MKQKIKDALIGEGLTYSKEVEGLLKVYDAFLQKNLQTEEYLTAEEQLNAILAQYEEEAFWHGFQSGIHLLLLSITDR